MDLKTISQVSREYGVSVRMLRYYEKEGLIESRRKEDYAYRVYDQAAIDRLQQVILLRKLRIPVRRITEILASQDASTAVEIFRQNIDELGEEIEALSTIRAMLRALTDALQGKVDMPLALLSDASILGSLASLPFVKHKIKEGLSMEDLNRANATLRQLAESRAKIHHPQENILETFDYNGVAVDLVEWTDTIWCGKMGYAADGAGEPDVEAIIGAYMALTVEDAVGRLEPDWDVCISLNYLSQRPNGVVIGFLVDAREQPGSFDVYEAPATRYLRIPLTDETARALGREPWEGGIPPYGWIGEDIAPCLGYRYGDDALPTFEYYGNYRPESNDHEFRYLYVPVENAK